jgi:hypothetical protein
MEVHVGKCNTTNFECRLCELTCDTLETLEMHLASCENYECSVCEIRFLQDMKTHIENTHHSSKLLYHLKMNRENPILVDFKSYKINEV